MPFPGVVVEGAAEEENDGETPMTDTQAYASAQSPLHVAPAMGFQVRNCANVIPWALAIESHCSFSLTK